MNSMIEFEKYLAIANKKISAEFLLIGIDWNTSNILKLCAFIMIQQQQKNNLLANLGDVKELTYYSKT